MKLALVALLSVLSAASVADAQAHQPGLYLKIKKRFAASTKAVGISDLPTFKNRSRISCTVVDPSDQYGEIIGPVFFLTKVTAPSGPLVPGKRELKPALLVPYTDNEQQMVTSFFDDLSFKKTPTRLIVSLAKNAMLPESPLEYELTKSDYIYVSMRSGSIQNYAYCYPTK